MYAADVVVWDLGWDPTQGIERLADLAETDIAPVLALVSNDAAAAEAWSAGARGLLPRNASPSALSAAVLAVSQGLVALDREFAGLLAKGDRLPTPLPEELTPREMEVLRLLAEGLPNKSIASRLGISEHTVKFHINAILGKLGAQSRTEAVSRGVRLGLILL
jgi:DNA-binding NarL/FixJ family response regulator